MSHGNEESPFKKVNGTISARLAKEDDYGTLKLSDVKAAIQTRADANYMHSNGCDSTEDSSKELAELLEGTQYRCQHTCSIVFVQNSRTQDRSTHKHAEHKFHIPWSAAQILHNSLDNYTIQSRSMTEYISWGRHPAAEQAWEVKSHDQVEITIKEISDAEDGTKLTFVTVNAGLPQQSLRSGKAWTNLHKTMPVIVDSNPENLQDLYLDRVDDIDSLTVFDGSILRPDCGGPSQGASSIPRQGTGDEEGMAVFDEEI